MKFKKSGVKNRIERIKTEEELITFIKAGNDYTSGVHFARLELNADDIARWILEGKFKRLKEELSLYNNIKFGCLKNDHYCQYYFFGNVEATNRILNLMSAILKNDPGHLVDFPPDESWRDSNYFKTGVGVLGQFNVCLLF